MNSAYLESLIHAHQLAVARRQAQEDRREAIDEVWRGADAIWSRVQQGVATRLDRSARRLQARLERRSAA